MKEPSKLESAPNAIPDTFCVIPWLHRHTDEQGFHKLCCIAHGDSNLLRSENGERLHVSQKLTDEQVLNSPNVRSTRAQMMRGVWPAICERCEKAEQAGGESPRKHLNSRFPAYRHHSLLHETAPDGFIEKPQVRYADIRLGNACNLTCRMCGPTASRLWAPIYNEIQPPAYRMDAGELTVLGGNNWVKQDSVAWLLQQCLPHVEVLHFAGGEPLIVPEMVEVLELCIESGRASEIDLSYNTNVTVLPERVTSLWRHFRGVALLCSVDGFGRTTEYIRRPSHWNDIEQNLKAIDRHFDDWHIRLAKVSCTTQILNVLSVDQLFEYLRAAGFSRFSSIPNLSPLSYPAYLSIQALPPAAKTAARNLLQREIDRAQELKAPDVNAAIGSIRATLAFMDAADTTRDLADFRAFCETSDSSFKDSWRDAAPELGIHLDAYWQPSKPGLAGLLRRLHWSRSS